MTVGGRRILRTGVVVALAAVGLGGSAAGGVARAQTAGAPSVTVAVTPYRILDTRNGTGTGGVIGPVGADQTITLQVAGVGPVPSDVAGAVLNITATEGTEASFVSAWPSGETRPNASILNVNPGLNLPNMITVALSADGRLDLYNLAGQVHLVADVAGYLVPGSGGGVPGPQGPQGPPGPSGIPPQQTLELSGHSALLPDTTTFTSTRAPFGCVNVNSDIQPFADEAVLDLPLPAGATITGVRVRYRDSSASTAMNISLREVDMPGGAGEGGASVPLVTTATNFYAIAALQLDAGLPPVSDTHWYHVSASAPNHPQNELLQFCGAAIDYTLAT